ncbi:MAG: transposase [Anaerolineales bacterium]|nr:transposase [Anaerolineales bacterium]
MPSPSPEIIQLLSVFSVAFTAPTFAKVMVLIFGTIMAPGRRTVTAALRMMGLGDDPHYSKYHRVLNRDRWSLWVVSKILLGLIILIFLPAGIPLILVIDETLERRRGKKIKHKGWFRDPILSTKEHVVTALGLRWICLAVLVPVPWSQRPWALPFMTVLALGQKTSARLNKRHRTLVQWTEFMIDKVRRWQPEREITLVGDGSYAAIVLVQHCQRLKKPVKLVSRLRLDARLFDSPAPQPKSKRGPKPKKGVRQIPLSQHLEDPETDWRKVNYHRLWRWLVDGAPRRCDLTSVFLQTISSNRLVISFLPLSFLLYCLQYLRLSASEVHHLISCKCFFSSSSYLHFLTSDLLSILHSLAVPFANMILL